MRNRLAIAVAAVILIPGSALLLGAAVRDVQPTVAPETGAPLTSAERAGRALFQRQCASCHVVGKEKGGDKGPDLTEVGAHHSVSWLHSYVENPGLFHPESDMAPFGPPVLTHEDIEEVARYMGTLRGPPGHRVPVEVHDTFPDLQKTGGDNAGKNAKPGAGVAPAAPLGTAKGL